MSLMRCPTTKAEHKTRSQLSGYFLATRYRRSAVSLYFCLRTESVQCRRIHVMVASVQNSGDLVDYFTSTRYRRAAMI